MLYVITGGSASGKSEYAEMVAVERAKQSEGTLYYLADMYPYDTECEAKIKRHREMRKEKGFTTMEQYYGFDKVNIQKNDILLLECVSNWLANEMYMEEGWMSTHPTKDVDTFVQYMISCLQILVSQGKDIVIVTNEIFQDGIPETKEMQQYVSIFGRINQALGSMADVLVEVICGIPVSRKGGLPC